MCRIGTRPGEEKIVVHHVATLDAVAARHELILVQAAVGEQHIHVAVLTQFQGFAGTYRDDLDGSVIRGLK